MLVAATIPKTITVWEENLDLNLDERALTLLRDLYLKSMMRGGGAEQDIMNLAHGRAWLLQVISLDFLLPIIQMEEIKEIIIHHHQKLQVELSGELHTIELKGLTQEDLECALVALSIKQKLSWNYTNPFVSVSGKFASHHFRFTYLHHSLTPSNRSKLFLRRIAPHVLPLSAFHPTPPQAELLKKALLSKKNIAIAGAAGSGKTTLLATLIQEIAAEEHLVILEDTHELGHQRNNNTTHLLADNEHPKRKLVDYCAYSLRLRPDRIILGEIRGEEIVPFFLAMNTGHRGLMCTLHANSASEAIDRFALLYTMYAKRDSSGMNDEMVRRVLLKNIDLVIFMHKKQITDIWINEELKLDLSPL
ncbi:MAG: Flp pilus assembly complex ATPase component TadA [Oligoflexia bacterium]|nr:Flp pilus assembly complex ATPase component TadA [Oligoflexia bacterium]MBF0365069.1 Flp pilus assembly complex ATPase component TadA [Oligoflexia bacterium]